MSNARTPSKSRKKATKKTRPPRQKTAEAVVAPAAVEAPKPTGVDGYVDPQKRMIEIDRRGLLLVAVRKASSRRGGGGRNKCWSSLGVATHVGIAEACVLERMSGEQIKERFRAELDAAKIADRTLYRFIRDIRESFDAVEASTMMAVREHDQAAFASGDLVALLGHTYARIGPMFIAVANEWIKPDRTADDLHPILRFLETMNDAAKTQSNAKHKEMQTVMLAIKAEAADGSKVRTPKDRATSQQRIVDLVDRFLRGEAA